MKEIHNQWIETIDYVNKVKDYVEDLEESINGIIAPLVYKKITDSDDNRKQVSHELNDIALKFEEITLDLHNQIHELRSKITQTTKGNVRNE